MPVDIADIMDAITATVGGIVPLATVALLAFFGFVIVGGTMLIKRTRKSLQ